MKKQFFAFMLIMLTVLLLPSCTVDAKNSDSNVGSSGNMMDESSVPGSTESPAAASGVTSGPDVPTVRAIVFMSPMNYLETTGRKLGH